MNLANSVHRSGFVSIVGKPNVGKSTLLNALLGQKISIVSPKAQTTRRRILGILSDEDYQIIFNDTPGIITPRYGLHQAMMRSVESAVEDAEIILLMVAANEKQPETNVLELLAKQKSSIILAVNKADLSDVETIKQKIEAIESVLPIRESLVIAALHDFNVQELLELLLRYLPEGPAYYDKELITDLPTRFFVAEIIREKIFLQYEKEIPYSTEVTISQYIERPNGVTFIEAEIHVERLSQKGILIGKQGEALKKIGSFARRDIEEFIEGPVYLQLYVRVTEEWKDKDRQLKSFGYTK